MQLIKRLSRVVLAAGIVSLLCGGSFAAAQNGNAAGNGFRISPTREELTVEKGKSQSIVITLENVTDAKVTARPILNDFIASENEGGEPRILLDEDAPVPSKSIKQLIAKMSDVVLNPRQKKEISVVVKVPPNAKTGGYYGAVRFAPVASGGQSTVNLTASVGTIVLVEVPGNIVRKLEIVDFTAAKNGKTGSLFSTGPVDALIRVKNTGDIHLKPFGKVTLKDRSGKVIEEQEINNVEPRSNVLPDSIRRFNIAFNKRNMFGKYTFETNMAFEQGSGEILSASKTFYVLPVWFIILLVAIVGGLIALAVTLVRRYKK